MKKPPRPGSPLESICAFVFTVRQNQGFQKIRSLLQGMITKENEESLKKVLQEYHSTMFPHEGPVKQWDQKPIMMELLKKQALMGPLSVTPMAPIASRNKQKIKLSQKDIRKY